MSDDQERLKLLALSAQIISAYVSINVVALQELSPLIEQVYQALKGAGAQPELVPTRPEPAVPIKKSVFPGYLICLEDGRKLKMLKRHLRAAYKMTPDEYRRRWGLSSDYPMVAPINAKHRSALAKHIGLGTKRSALSDEEAERAPPAKGRARSGSAKAPSSSQRRGRAAGG